MSEHKATVEWVLSDEKFIDNRYSRRHRWTFDGGISVQASASPQVVPLPMSVEDAVDPEEAFVASLSSCHMLWFLSIIAKRGYTVVRYVDNAIGKIGKNVEGKLAVTTVVLRPELEFSGDKTPTQDEVLECHHQAHEKCFIANSVITEVTVEPVFD